jgi:hypothetical protein
MFYVTRISLNPKQKRENNMAKEFYTYILDCGRNSGSPLNENTPILRDTLDEVIEDVTQSIYDYMGAEWWGHHGWEVSKQLIRTDLETYKVTKDDNSDNVYHIVKCTYPHKTDES